MSENRDFALLAASAVGLDRLDIEPAHEIVDGTLSIRASDKRLEVRYVAIDPFPPASYWPADGSRGCLSTPAEPSGVPVSVGADGVQEAAVGEATHSYHPPEGMEPDAWRRLLRGYGAWRTGETFGVVSEFYAVDMAGGTATPVSVEADWGGYDLESASALVFPDGRPSLPFAP